MKNLGAFAACFLVLTTAPAAQAQTIEAGTTAAVIGQIGEELRQTLDKATQSGDFLAVRATQQALFVLDAFKKSNEDLLDKAFDKIGRERQAILNELRNTVREVNAGRVDTLQKLESTTDQLDRLVRDSTFKSYPVIYRYRGSIVTPGETQNVILNVDGFKLARVAPPVLRFRGKEYRPQVTGDKLRFELPRELFVAENNQMKNEAATLALTYKSGGFLGIGGSTKVVDYDLGIVTLPNNLGTVEVNYTEVGTVRETESWEREESRRRSGHGGWDCKGYAYTPKDPSRRFDTDLTSVRQGSGNGNGRLEDVRVTSTGISFRICVRRRYWDNGPGYRHAIVSATEFWNEEQKTPRQHLAGLTWTSNVPVQTPEKIENLLVTVRDFTGTTRTLSASGGNAGRYVRVEYDRDSNVVLITPMVPAELNAL